MNIKDLTLKSEGCYSNKIPVNLLGSVKVVKKAEDEGRRIIAGYANIAVVDSERQLIPTEVLQAGIDTLMNDPSYSNLMLFHKNIQIGKILPEYGKLKTHVDDKGLYIIAEIRKDTEIANETWKQILDGDINGFSIGCEVIGEPVTKCDTNGKNCVEVLSDINIFEVSVTSAPVNDMSGFVIVSKSKYNENLDLSNYSNVCDECIIDKDIMSEKEEKSEAEDEKESNAEEKEESDKKTEEQEQEIETKEEKSVEDRIESMERSISNIAATISKLTESLNSEEEDKSENVDEDSDEKEKSETELEDDSNDEDTKEKEKSDEENESEEEKSTETSLDDVMKAIEDIKNVLKTEKSEEKEKSEIDELKLAVKARDDQIEALNKKIEILGKSKEEKKQSKTVNEENGEEEPDIELDDPFTVERGEVYLRY